MDTIEELGRRAAAAVQHRRRGDRRRGNQRAARCARGVGRRGRAPHPPVAVVGAAAVAAAIATGIVVVANRDPASDLVPATTAPPNPITTPPPTTPSTPPASSVAPSTTAPAATTTAPAPASGDGLAVATEPAPFLEPQVFGSAGVTTMAASARPDHGERRRGRRGGARNRGRLGRHRRVKSTCSPRSPTTWEASPGGRRAPATCCPRSRSRTRTTPRWSLYRCPANAEVGGGGDTGSTRGRARAPSRVDRPRTDRTGRPHRTHQRRRRALR